MRTIKLIKDENKRIDISMETLEIFSPLAQRLGMKEWQDELEDLSFAVLNQPARDLINERLKFIKNNRDDTFKSISIELIDLLKKKWN